MFLNHFFLFKKFLEKTALDIYNGIQCNKKCESIYNHPIVTGRK